ncbi:MAG: hypothetical protein M1817_005629 [Caeruleum heppii]|nr:MAG: hypothetical protein M1817_005629 [Caeruleum heppii]
MSVEQDQISADGHLQEETTVSETAPAELTAVVDALLENLSSKFTSVSTELFNKMDDMSRRLNALEEALQLADTNSSK